MTTSDNERIAYLSGEVVASLSPHERAELDELRDLLKAPATWVEPGPDLEDRVAAAIAAEAGTARDHLAAEGAGADSPRSRPLQARLPRPRRRLFSARPAFGLAGLAAAAAVAIVVAVGLSNTSRTPLRFAMVVSGTALAPDAHGSATLTKTASGWRIELAATGLPHLAGASYYEAWLKNAAGILVPVGTFNDARSVTLWSGVPVTQFRSLAVTRQRANGNPSSSGLRVLSGTIR